MVSHPFDIAIFNFFHSSTCTMDIFAKTALFISNNSMYLWFLFLLIIAVIKKQYYPLLLSIAGFYIAWHVGDDILKPHFDRMRPPLELHSCVIGEMPTSSSFPSGHTLTSFALFTLIYLYNRSNLFIWIPALLFAFFNGYLRIYLGVHFPTDILGGILAGSLLGSIWYFSTEFARKKYNEKA